MKRNWINYLTATLFFFAAFRDWFLPGRFQMHSGASNSPWMSIFLGSIFLAGALRDLWRTRA